MALRVIKKLERNKAVSEPPVTERSLRDGAKKMLADSRSAQDERLVEDAELREKWFGGKRG